MIVSVTCRPYTPTHVIVSLPSPPLRRPWPRIWYVYNAFVSSPFPPQSLRFFSPEEDAIMQVKKIVYITWKEVVLVRGHTNEF